MKIMFFTPVPSEAAACRVRIEQYIPFLELRGHVADVRPFMLSEFFSIVYRKGCCFKKIGEVVKNTVRRCFDVNGVKNYDAVFIFREIYPFGPAFFEEIVHRLRKPIIFDLDDAIYLPNTSAANKIASFIKHPQKTFQIAKISKKVIVGNEYLLRQIRKFNKDVTIIPTCVDTSKFILKNNYHKRKQVTIGWIGTNTTSAYLDLLENVFKRLALKYDYVLKIVGAGREINIKGVNVDNKEWDLDNEVMEFQSLDIGIYPLTNDEWAKGKSGFKTLLYMSVGVPPISSPVGVNNQIINDGVNGFLAETEDEWFDKISFLIENEEARRQIGMKGRITVEEEYSLKVNAPKFVDTIESIC